MLVPRLIGALKGDIATFEEVEHDESATMQAAMVVLVAAVLTGVGAGLANSLADTDVSFGRALIASFFATIVGWVLWSAITHFVGSRFFGAESTLGEMLRVIGFAHVALWLAIIPIVNFFAGLWFLWIAFKAIRTGLDLEPRPTLFVLLIGLIIRIAANILPGV
jgi:hypothetical protein